MTLGENIKKHRLERGWSLRKLAKRLGMTPQSIGKWERNEISPSVYAMWDLADIFGCSIDELCGRKEGSYEKEEN